jgi:hypothetical protein
MDLFVRQINLHRYERVFPPMQTAVASHRRGFINEIAFALFEMMSASGDRQLIQDASIVDFTVLKARDKVAASTRFSAATVPLPDEEETRDFLEQHRRLLHFFRSQAGGSVLEIGPLFPGCGMMDTCVADVIAGGALFEVKAGDRPFRSIDVRQLLIYGALNSAGPRRPLAHFGLYNPRTGVSCKFAADELAMEVSGRSASDLLSDIVYVISSGDISR